ncbi:MAG: lysophospholipase [Alphaproteobacteria bacterium]|uniref:alpha/beta fold hydrolase n=1 Tax=Brevundimonas sp. TaxID=1871086 RepID=UPI0017FB1295|nr:alpha/beta fold hydrolase [Brevundimonas sp.]MBA3049530.1 lysophospholipase [Brevundimonas sp.]MBU3971025.1 lysophospholipase [Alphaproteobacteria bacterium]MBU3974776.1 lysophospholipase [Alphaproteobacteria bacterium]MBU4137778.1 lysophospholipase [Alphaproteobacteria bacterium]
MIRSLAALFAVLALTACATPAIQAPMTPPSGFAGAALESRALLMDDGARLPLARWTPDNGEPWAVIVALHGMNDSRASFRLAGPWWAERGIETWAFDQRGFGGAPGRGVWAGQARMAEDLRTAVALARARHPRAVIAVAGESMGGAVTIAAFASDRPPDADRVILLAPAVWGWSAQGPVNSAGLWIAARAMGDRAVDAPEWAIRDHPASDNRLELFRNGRDPNSILSTRFDALYGLVDLMETASMRLGDVRTPTLLLYGAHDNVIQTDPMRRALERAGERPGLRTAYYPDGWHILNRDLQAQTVYRDVEAWLRDAAAPLPSGSGPVLPALRQGGRR